MGKNKKNFFSRLLGFFKRRKVSSGNGDENKIRKQNFLSEWNLASQKIKSLLPLLFAPIGFIWESKSLKVSKTNQNLFKLEGKTFQFLLVTGSSIQKNSDGNYTGIIIDEKGKFHRAIQSEIKTAEELFQKLELPFPEVDSQVGESWKAILQWERFWQAQLLAKLRPNVIAILSLLLGEEFKKFLVLTTSERQLELVRDELFYLNLGKVGQAYSPHSKNFHYYEFGTALQEFNQRILEVTEKRKQSI
ncbi:hypothetical protein LPTSP4_05250 [Leptospira ryugenii]|uniref:Uncharacterized protein n=1 Tax=Leptospira ryugenii TaxID=1917863 RepID=A0A2P2DWN0_9LEPT|nr:hypothetical protein [Leptospira ryugenii]GBF49016.1 hypothetical protein LPTSP4_05250 [Leptospira ryugenii]